MSTQQSSAWLFAVKTLLMGGALPWTDRDEVIRQQQWLRDHQPVG
ncbi:hypothetical protein [Psychrobacter immobilis]|nr:hypothetical protein [Psychrobacter immobilis]